MTKILAIGTGRKLIELKKVLTPQPGKDIQLETFPAVEDAVEQLNLFRGNDLIIDLNFDNNLLSIQHYAPLEDKPVIVSSVKEQLARITYNHDRDVRCYLFGMNALPTFINRDMWEMSLINDAHDERLAVTMKKLGLSYRLVADRVGMVTPRVIFMIINEACYTVQEGTATIRDIDTAMKLGTNYPYGPFEWADRIGISEVYQTLRAIYEDTRDARYKVCPLLKTKHQQQTFFYDQ